MGVMFYVLPFRSNVDASEEAISVTIVRKAVEITDSFISCQFSGWKCVFVLARRFLVLRAEMNILITEKCLVTLYWPYSE
jgi:hypothetical protein